MEFESKDYSYLDLLSDDMILAILQYIRDFQDLYNLRLVSRRIANLSVDVTLTRHAHCTGNYWVSTGKLHFFLRPITMNLETLNLGLCYWIKFKDFNVIRQCTKLRCLNLLQINVPLKALCEVLSGLPFLTSLSFSIRDIDDLHVQLASSPGAQLCMSQLHQLGIHFSKSLNYGKVTEVICNSGPTLFEYCRSVEEINVYGDPNAAKGVPRSYFQPQIIQVENLRNVKRMTLNACLDPVARVFFFEALRAVCQLPVQFTCLLQPSCVVDQMWAENDYKQAMTDISSLVHLDVSGRRLTIPNRMIKFETAQNLRYINLADNDKVFAESLRLLARYCPLLTSVNLQNCLNVIYERELDYRVPQFQEELREILDMTGIQSLVVDCVELQHLNLSGVHIHAHDLASTQFYSLTCLLFMNPNWKSLSLSPCCLREHTCANNNFLDKSDLDLSYRCDRCRLLLRSPQSALASPTSEELCQTGFDLEKLIHTASQMESFELICTGFKSSFTKRQGILPTACTVNPCPAAARVRDEDLVHIGRWYKLKSLQLTAISGVRLGGSLMAIAKGCVFLQHLYISCLGQITHCTYKVCLQSAFPFFTQLKELRLEHPLLEVDRDFLAGVSRCAKLERICIISQNGSYDRVGVARLFEALPRLVSFQLYTGDSVEESDDLCQLLMEKYRATRPALNVCINPLLHRDLQLNVSNTQADQHVDEMTLLKSRVACKPPSK